jgi:hypothetical protein
VKQVPYTVYNVSVLHQDDQLLELRAEVSPLHGHRGTREAASACRLWYASSPNRLKPELQRQRAYNYSFDSRSISAHCGAVTGMTERREMRTSAKSANFELALISASVTGRSSRWIVVIARA